MFNVCLYTCLFKFLHTLYWLLHLFCFAFCSFLFSLFIQAYPCKHVLISYIHHSSILLSTRWKSAIKNHDILTIISEIRACYHAYNELFMKERRQKDYSSESTWVLYMENTWSIQFTVCIHTFAVIHIHL